MRVGTVVRVQLQGRRVRGWVVDFPEVPGTDRPLQPIANYFRSRSTNGPTEGFNHGLRLLLWRAFGMTNFAHFRLRVLDRFGQVQAQ